MKRIAFIAAFLAASAAAAQSPQSPERQVDALFATWNRPGMPGAVVGVIRDGKVLFTKGYGMADIERGVPMTPAAEFFIGSMSKQFTAFAIHLLAQDGKLSLDDDVRTFLPEVPDFGKKITIRHLLHHTSGLRARPGMGVQQHRLSAARANRPAHVRKTAARVCARAHLRTPRHETHAVPA
jgi:CubicO group peptidase (beta-lactamase class C family)